jgi:hypothetical protein
LGNTLFNRDLVLNVGGLRIASRLSDQARENLGLQTGDVATILRVVFKVTRSLKKEPNKAEITLYNLKESNRTALQERNQSTTLEAGYVDNISQLFSGDLEFAQNKQDGRNWITALQSGDSSVAYKSAHINTSLKGPAGIGDVLRTAAKALGLGDGNLEETIANGSLRGKLTEFVNGVVLSGKAELNVDKIAKSMGLSWSIQDGQHLFLGPTQTREALAVKLTPGSGLVGSPEAGEDGVLSVRSLIQPDLLPGQKIQIQSGQVDGYFRVEKTVFTGDTRGKEWYADMECKPL